MNTATFGLDFPTAPGQQPLFDPAGEVVGPIQNTDLRGSLSQTILDMSALEWIHSAGSSLDASRLLRDWLLENGFNAEYEEVNADHGGMIPLVLPDIFTFFRSTQGS